MTPEAASSLAAVAFDRAAPSYDATFGRNPIGLYFRHIVQERLRLAFPPGAHVLDLGCGTGDDALFLAGLGVRVHAVDPAAGMVGRARSKAAQQGLGEARVRFEVRAAEAIDFVAGAFDGAYSNFGALNCADLAAVGRGLARALRPGAPVILCVIGPRPLPGLVEQALTGRRVLSFEEPARVAGVPVPARGLSLRELRDGLGPDFSWKMASGLGVLVPAPGHHGWAERNPVAFGLLAAAERLVRAWPVARGFGDHLLVEGVRR